MNFHQLINGPRPVLVSFGAAWCEPCKWLEPILDEIQKSLEGRLDIEKIDIDDEPKLKAEYHIMSVPTLLLFSDGKIRWRYQGFDTVPNMRRIILEHLESAG
jgi:thioredoxin 1